MKFVANEAFCFSCRRHKKLSIMFSIGERSICNACNKQRAYWNNQAVLKRKEQEHHVR